MQTKAPMKYHYIHIGIVKTKTKTTKFWKWQVLASVQDNCNFHTLLTTMQRTASNSGNQLDNFLLSEAYTPHKNQQSYSQVFAQKKWNVHQDTGLIVTKKLYINVVSNFIHNHENMETTHMSSNLQMDEHMVVYPYNGLWLSNEKRWYNTQINLMYTAINKESRLQTILHSICMTPFISQKGKISGSEIKLVLPGIRDSGTGWLWRGRRQFVRRCNSFLPWLWWQLLYCTMLVQTHGIRH